MTVVHTCLWKLSSRRALSSMVALVRKSPAREPGRFSSSAMRWVIRACNLKKQVQRVVISQKKMLFVQELMVRIMKHQNHNYHSTQKRKGTTEILTAFSLGV